jgi:hypothetical protein
MVPVRHQAEVVRGSYNINRFKLTSKNCLVYSSASVMRMALPKIPMSRPILKSYGINGVIPSDLRTIWRFKN